MHAWAANTIGANTGYFMNDFLNFRVSISYTLYTIQYPTRQQNTTHGCSVCKRTLEIKKIGKNKVTAFDIYLASTVVVYAMDSKNGGYKSLKLNAFPTEKNTCM
jgi:hypothetical protein